MIPVSRLIGRSLTNRYLIKVTSENRLKREVARLKRSDFRVMLGKKFLTDIPTWVYRKYLVYYWKYDKPRVCFLSYYKSLLDPKYYIEGHYDYLITNYKRHNSKTVAYHKLRYGKYWKLHWKAEKARLNIYDVDSVMQMHNVSRRKAEEIVDRRKSKTAGTFENFVRRCDGDVKLAKKRFSEFARKSSHTEEKFRKKYGDKFYLEHWERYKRSKNSYALERYVAKYGDVLGREELERRRVKSVVDYKKYVELYGERRAAKEYARYCLKKTRKWKHSATRESLELFRPIMRWLDQNRVKYLVGIDGNKELVLFDRELCRPRFYDFAIPSAKIIVEFDGASHPDPLLTRKERERWRCFYSGVSADTRDADDLAKEQLAIRCGYQVIRVHYTHFKKNKLSYIKRVRNEITNALERANADHVR